MISISGITEQATAIGQKRLETSGGANATPAATATTAWEITEGTSHPLLDVSDPKNRSADLLKYSLSNFT